MGKVYTLFQTKTAQKTLPDGAAHTYMAYIKEYPPPGLLACFNYVMPCTVRPLRSDFDTYTDKS